MRARGFSPRLLGLVGGHQHQRRGPVVEAGGVGRRHRAVLGEGGAQAGDRSRRSRRGGCIRRRSTTVSPLRPLMVTGAISSSNRPAFCAASALFWRGDGETVLVFAGDLPAGGDVLGRLAHVVAVEGVPQPVLDHGVDEGEVAHLLAVAQVLRRAATGSCSPGRRRRRCPRRLARSAGRRARRRAGPSRKAG